MSLLFSCSQWFFSLIVSSVQRITCEGLVCPFCDSCIYTSNIHRKADFLSILFEAYTWSFVYIFGVIGVTPPTFTVRISSCKCWYIESISHRISSISICIVNVRRSDRNHHHVSWHTVMISRSWKGLRSCRSLKTPFHQMYTLRFEFVGVFVLSPWSDLINME